MIDVTVKNLLKVQKALKGQPRKINLVLSRAVNRAATNAKANMAKKVREQYNVKAADVKDTIKITKATSSSPVAHVKSTGQKISLAKFKISPKEPRPKNPPKGGYKSQVKKSGGPKMVPRGFLVNVRGYLAFFQRVGKSRLPIKRLMGPAVPEMIGRKDIIKWVENEAKSMLNKRIEHELEQVLEAKPK